MNKLARIIQGMDIGDLERIKLDLDEGNIRRLIEQRLGELDDENKVCPVCSREISGNDFVLEFGKLGLRMKASFDGLDCLRHFIAELSESSSS